MTLKEVLFPLYSGGSSCLAEGGGRAESRRAVLGRWKLHDKWTKDPPYTSSASLLILPCVEAAEESVLHLPSDWWISDTGCSWDKKFPSGRAPTQTIFESACGSTISSPSTLHSVLENELAAQQVCELIPRGEDTNGHRTALTVGTYTAALGMANGEKTVLLCGYLMLHRYHVFKAQLEWTCNQS